MPPGVPTAALEIAYRHRLVWLALVCTFISHSPPVHTLGLPHPNADSPLLEYAGHLFISVPVARFFPPSPCVQILTTLGNNGEAIRWKHPQIAATKPAAYLHPPSG